MGLVWQYTDSFEDNHTRAVEALEEMVTFYLVAALYNLAHDDSFAALAATKPGLLPFPSEPNGDGTDWLDLPTAQEGGMLAGWTMTRNTDHGKGGVVEWSGWTFASPPAWAAAAPDQDRDQFALGTNVIAVADSDEFADVAGGSPFDATLSTPPIDISGATAGSLTLKFDSGWRAQAQVGTI